MPAGAKDLDTVNQIVARSLEGWGLPERVYRMSLRSFLYNAVDTEHMELTVAWSENGTGAGVAAWEPDFSSEDSSEHRPILLHGLYVVPTWQGRGVGTRLLDSGVQRALERDFGRIVVKAWRDAEGFFRARGFRIDPSDAGGGAYPVNLSRPLCAPS